MHSKHTRRVNRLLLAHSDLRTHVSAEILRCSVGGRHVLGIPAPLTLITCALGAAKWRRWICVRAVFFSASSTPLAPMVSTMVWMAEKRRMRCTCTSCIIKSAWYHSISECHRRARAGVAIAFAAIPLMTGCRRLVSSAKYCWFSGSIDSASLAFGRASEMASNSRASGEMILTFEMMLF
jgi:hypothetical protein